MNAVVTGLVIALLLTPSAICVAKSKYWLAVLAVVGLVFPIVGTLRLAKPDSWWARRFYGPNKLVRAQQRFAPKGQGFLDAA